MWSEIWHSADEWLQSLESILRADSVVLRGGNYDSWDLEVRAGTLGAARLLMTIEEHGAGRQLIRFRVSPRRSAIRLSLIFLLLAISIFAALSQAWITTGIFAAAALALIARKVVERSVAVGTILTGLNVLKTKTEGSATARSKAEGIVAEAQSILHPVYRLESSISKVDSIYGEAEVNVRSALKKVTQPAYIEGYLEELQPTIKIKKARA